MKKLLTDRLTDDRQISITIAHLEHFVLRRAKKAMTEFKSAKFVIEMCCPRQFKDKWANNVPYLFHYKMEFPLSRMTTNN